MMDNPMMETNEQQPGARRKIGWGWIAAGLLILAFLLVVAVQLVKTQQGSIASELRGVVLVVNFWASWCTPCEQEAADLQAAWEMYSPDGQVQFLGVDYVDTEAEALEYMHKFDITYPSGPDLGTRISQAFRIVGVPETYIIDQQGTLVYKQIGPFTSLAQITSVIDPLLGP
jgi:cytochrome c biogenesis protein CcmG/thiol:disulfide interchange protein DsbE